MHKKMFFYISIGMMLILMSCDSKSGKKREEALRAENMQLKAAVDSLVAVTKEAQDFNLGIPFENSRKVIAAPVAITRFMHSSNLVLSFRDVENKVLYKTSISEEDAHVILRDTTSVVLGIRNQNITFYW
jgi:hypothetical protein